MELIQLKKQGYDPYIDFIKGLCIIAVVFTHALPSVIKDVSLFCLWGEMAVPIFLLIQVFHAYKQGLDCSKPILTLKIFKRIIIPFVITLTIILGGKSICHSEDWIANAQKMFMGGGGPGSYYPWIYVQFAVVLALLRPILKKISFTKIVILFVLFSILIEILLSYIHLSPSVYRMMFIRYTFLILLALDWINNGFKIDFKRIVLSVIGLVSILIFHYTNINMEPIFNNNAWHDFHWICYFWVAYALTWLIGCVYSKIQETKFVKKVIIPAGVGSYEIFLVQMAVFALFPQHSFVVLDSKVTNFALWFALVVLLSLMPVILYQNFKRGRCAQKNR